MWHDNETTTDYLNFGVVADACAKLLQQANGQPISIGVSGGWGVGKSSLVRMVASRLNVDADPDKNTYVVVTFNPWLYQDFEGARSALLQMVGDEVLRRAAADEGLVKKAKGFFSASICCELFNSGAKRRQRSPQAFRLA